MIQISRTLGTTMLAGAVGLWAASAPVATTPAPDWKIAGPFGGTATTLALDPEKPSVLLAGGLNSLLFKSEDSGVNWELLNFPKLSLSEVTSVLVDPADSNHYLAGVISALGGGMFESADAGKTWHGVKGMSDVGVRALAASASNPSRFVAGTLRGVWLSDDSGKTWSRISDPLNFEMAASSAVAIDTKDPNIIYAGTSHLPWKTTDGGKTWESIHTGMIDDSDVFSIYVNPSDPGEVLASACSGLYLSGSRGDQWKKLMGIPNTSRRTHVVREDPTNASTIYAGTTTGLFKSTNRGGTWRTLNDTQVNLLVFDPSRPSTMYLALEYSGIGKSNDGGEAIDLTNHGFVDRSIAAVARSGNKLVAIDGATVDGASGMFVSNDAGETWTQLHHMHGVEGVHLKSITGLSSEDRILLAANSHNMYKSIDGGLTWKPLPVRLVETIAPPVESTKSTTTSRSVARGKQAARSRTTQPAQPTVKTREVRLSEISALYTIKNGTKDFIFAATDLGLLRSDDDGERWTVVNLTGSPAVTALFSSPNNDGRLVVRAAGALFLSKDYGEHWDELRFPVPASDVHSVAIPADPDCPLLIATRTGLYSSSDGGTRWSLNTSGLPASTVTSVVYAGKDRTAYAVEYGQLYETTDGGTAWKPVPTAIPNLHIRQLWMPDSASGRLYGITSDLGILFRD